MGQVSPVIYFVDEQPIRRVMEELGLEYLQARNHLLGRQLAAQAEQRRRADLLRQAIRTIAEKEPRLREPLV